MTLFGVDISHWQAGMDVARVKQEGFAWVEARCSIGAEPDASFAGFKTQAANAGLLFCAYHFLLPSRLVSIETQVSACADAIRDTRCAVMVDHEPNGSGAATPTVADAIAFAEGMRARSYRVPLWYLPHWVWLNLGSPELPANSGMRLVASSYVAGTGYASVLYPGAAHWPAAYGGQTPVIWQFTDRAEVAGMSVDADAFEGSLAQLRALLLPPPRPTFYDPKTHPSVLVSPDGSTACYFEDDGRLHVVRRGVSVGYLTPE